MQLSHTQQDIIRDILEELLYEEFRDNPTHFGQIDPISGLIPNYQAIMRLYLAMTGLIIDLLPQSPKTIEALIESFLQTQSSSTGTGSVSELRTVIKQAGKLRSVPPR
ncbi:MAG: hypothetical protein ACM3QZ_00420 [Solirubrobacterales bacterium]